MISHPSLRVLITGGGTANAVSVLKGLRWQREIPVHITLGDAAEVVAGGFLADTFVRLPPGSDPDFADTLLRICLGHDIKLVVSTIDFEFEAWAERASDFLSHGIRVAISPLSAIRTCSDKAEFAMFLERLALPGARVYSRDQVLERRVPFPLFVKPRRGGRGSLGTHVARDVMDLDRILSTMDDPLVQEFIDGEEYTIDTISDFDGRFLAAMPRVRRETKAGVSVKGCTVDDPEMVAMAKAIAEALPIIGPSNIQCFRKRDGSLIVSEANLRFSGALALSLAAGLNGPLILLKMVRGEKVDPSRLPLQYGVQMFRFWEETFLYPDGTATASPWGSYPL